MAGETNNKVLYGIEQCYVAKITETEEGITYETSFPMPGAVGLNFDPEGEKKHLFMPIMLNILLQILIKDIQEI
ncbi:MAG: hypothetical protein V8R30_05270 [Clostridia bacterium]